MRNTKNIVKTKNILRGGKIKKNILNVRGWKKNNLVELRIAKYSCKKINAASVYLIYVLDWSW